MNTDTRPVERIQHSWEGYGKFVHRYYGPEAYQDWLRSVARCYGNQERRTNPVHVTFLNSEGKGP